MKNIRSLVRPNIQKLKPYISARSLCQEKGLILLDANENPYGDGFRNRYPDPLQETLRKKIADLYSLDLKNVLFGNGSDELIDLLIRVFCEPTADSITICPPTFGFYTVAAEINDVATMKIPLSAEFKLDVQSILKTESKILFLPNPNAPTGNVFQKEALEKILKNFKGIVALDEAYVDFSKSPSWVSRLEEFPNLVVLQTFSKYWGLAGCRIGMVFASQEIINTLIKIKAPYNLNNLSAQEALSALERVESIEKNAQVICSEREKLRKQLQMFPFFQNVYPSEANFLWIECQKSWEVCDFLKQVGISVRKYTDEPNFLRISIGLPIENQELITA